MKNNSWMMLICCLGPLLFFIVGPALGLNKENSFWVLIPVMLVFFMMMRKGGGCCGGHEDKKSDPAKKDGEKKAGCH